MSALVLANGRVIDPATGHDATADVRIDKGWVVGVGPNLAQADETVMSSSWRGPSAPSSTSASSRSTEKEGPNQSSLAVRSCASRCRNDRPEDRAKGLPEPRSNRSRGTGMFLAETGLPERLRPLL
jgi:hypothetical protein